MTASSHSSECWTNHVLPVVTRNDQIQYFVEHFGSATLKTKQILQDNLIALIAVLAYDDVSTSQKQQREMVLFQLMAVSIDSITNNYKLKDFPQDKVIPFFNINLNILSTV